MSREDTFRIARRAACLELHGPAHVEKVASAPHRHVEQPTFFFELVGQSGSQIGWQATIGRMDQHNHVPFAIFRGMDGREHAGVIILRQWARMIAASGGRIEREISEKFRKPPIGSGDSHKIFKIAHPGFSTVVDSRTNRSVEFASPSDCAHG